MFFNDLIIFCVLCVLFTPKGKLYFVPYPNWCTTNDNTFACDFVNIYGHDHMSAVLHLYLLLEAHHD